MMSSESLQMIKMEASRANPRRKERSKKIRTASILLLMLLAIISFVKQEYTLYTVKKRANDLRSELALLKSQNELLNQKIKALNDDEIIMQIARDSMGLTKEDEIQYILEEIEIPSIEMQVSDMTQ